MTRKQLEDLGLPKEQVDAIIKINGDDIENAKAASAAEIKNLQAENTRAKESHEAEMNQLRVDFAVEKALAGAKAKNVTAVKALLDLKDAKLDKDGNVKGLQEQIDKLTADEGTKFLFDAGQAAFKGFQPGATIADSGSVSVGYESRLADARKNNNQLEIIRIKQEAAAEGIILM